jgi:hypothetical protein
MNFLGFFRFKRVYASTFVGPARKRWPSALDDLVGRLHPGNMSESAAKGRNRGKIAPALHSMCDGERYSAFCIRWTPDMTPVLVENADSIAPAAACRPSRAGKACPRNILARPPNRTALVGRRFGSVQRRIKIIRFCRPDFSGSGGPLEFARSRWSRFAKMNQDHSRPYRG